MTNLALYSAEGQCNNFENLKANLFSTDIFTDDVGDPDINFYNEKLQELDSVLFYSKRNRFQST